MRGIPSDIQVAGVSGQNYDSPVILRHQHNCVLQAHFIARSTISSDGHNIGA